MSQKLQARRWIDAPAPAAVYDLLAGAVKDAVDEVPRLADLDDGEAVHDFRVAVRRLRTFLRAYTGILPLDEGLQVRLRELTGLTNATRDDEAHVEWLRQQLEDPDLDAGEREAVRALLCRLDGRPPRDAGLESTARRVLDRVSRELAACEPAIEAVDGAAADGAGTDVTFGQVTAGVLDHEAKRLGKRLGRIETEDDVRRIHRARLSEKRLRYVLEPVVGLVRGARGPVERLKRLQDTLGELHDLSSLGERLSNREPELARMVRRRRAGLYAALEADWLHDGAEGFFADVRRVTRDLREV